uniref:Vitellogenin receptor n=1 Tax=Ditylenchus dipsaci TaxID=166011 RepID=A0A915D8L4_9BILA
MNAKWSRMLQKPRRSRGRRLSSHQSAIQRVRFSSSSRLLQSSSQSASRWVRSWLRSRPKAIVPPKSPSRSQVIRRSRPMSKKGASKVPQNHHVLYCNCSGKLNFSCGEGATPACVPSAWRCDNVKDCSNGKDEVNCNYIFCPINTFKCKSRECLAPSTKCDGKEDCADGSDEAFCDAQTSTPSQNHQNQQQHNIEEQGGEISLDSSAEHIYQQPLQAQLCVTNLESRTVHPATPDQC